MSEHFRVLKLAAVSSRSGVKKRRPKDGQEAEDKFSIPHQLAMCDALFPGRPAWIDVGTITIPGHSRRYDFLQDLIADCKEYADMIARVERRECDGLLMAYFDRAQRGVILAPQLAVFCADHGVQIRAVDRFSEFLPPEQFAGLSPIDKMMYAFEGFAAESYAAAMREKTWPALQARVRGGLPIQGTTPYGYEYVDVEAPPRQVPEQVAWLRRGREWRVRELWGWSRMAQEANLRGWRTQTGGLWYPFTMKYLYTNPFYAGYVRYGDILVRGQHESVWSEGEWAELQEVNERLLNRRLRRQVHEFSGLCRCGFCGLPMAYHWDGHAQRLMCASAYRYRHDRRVPDPRPPRHPIYYVVDRLRAYVIDLAQRALSDPEEFAAARAAQAQGAATEDLATLEAALRDNRRRVERWDRAYEAEDIDSATLKSHHERLDAERRQLEQRTVEARAREMARLATGASLRELAGTQAELDRLLARLPEAPELERRRLWLLLIRRIVLRAGDDPIVEWR